MNIFENKLKPISIEWITNYIENLYYPYKEFGDLKKLLKDEPNYIYPTKYYNGQLKKWVKNGDESYIIKNPKSNEINKIKDFREFENTRAKLVELRNLQIKFANKELEKPDEILLEKQIEKLYSIIFEVSDDYLITKQRIIFNKLPKGYIFSKKEEENLRRRYEKTDIKKYKKSKLPDEYGNYKISFKPLIDHEINSALKRNYNVFNEKKKNYRIIKFENIGKFELFKINNKEYLIEKNSYEKGVYISIYNYEYYRKWLKFLDGLIGNYNIGQFNDVKEKMINDAKEKSINNIENIIENIENLFYHSLDYHNHSLYENIEYNSNRYLVLSLLPNRLFSWKHIKEEEIINAKNSLIRDLQNLFITSNMFHFMQVRDFAIFWIGNYIDITINNNKRMFQWAYSPFMNDIFTIKEKIYKLFSDDKITLKNNIQSTIPKVKPQQKDKNAYSLKAVKVAYFCLDKRIDKHNYKKILKKYTNSTSDKILQKPIFKSSQLTSLSEDKTADKKHLNALNDAERLLSGIKNDKATKSIKQFISTFESNFNDFYN